MLKIVFASKYDSVPGLFSALITTANQGFSPACCAFITTSDLLQREFMVFLFFGIFLDCYFFFKTGINFWYWHFLYFDYGDWYLKDIYISYQYHHHNTMLFYILLHWRYVVPAHTLVKATSLDVLVLPRSCLKRRRSWWNRGKVGRALLWNAFEKQDAVRSPRKACCIKGCAGSKHVALVAGTTNAVDSSVLRKEKKEKAKKGKPAGPGAKCVHWNPTFYCIHQGPDT